MGQTASKVPSQQGPIAKAAENAARKVMDAVVQPPVPKGPHSSTTQASKTSKNATMTSRTTGRTTVAHNPAMFLRGTGIATEDIRDQGQELYLKSLRNTKNHKYYDDITEKHNKSEAPSKQPQDQPQEEGVPDMPEDLLKFIQDVGPARKQIDKEFTAPRLLQQEHQAELYKVESVRQKSRERIQMPLMGEDQNFTTTRNALFSKSSSSSALKQQGEAEKEDFGISILELYRLLQTVRDHSSDPETALQSFYQAHQGNVVGDLQQQQQKELHLKLLRHVMDSIEIPVLRQDMEGNFFGLYPQDVPGPEVKSVTPVPETQIQWVMQDLWNRQTNDEKQDIAASNLEQRRSMRRRELSQSRPS